MRRGVRLLITWLLLLALVYAIDSYTPLGWIESAGMFAVLSLAVTLVSYVKGNESGPRIEITRVRTENSEAPLSKILVTDLVNYGDKPDILTSFNIETLERGGMKASIMVAASVITFGPQEPVCDLPYEIPVRKIVRCNCWIAGGGMTSLVNALESSNESWTIRARARFRDSRDVVIQWEGGKWIARRARPKLLEWLPVRGKKVGASS